MMDEERCSLESQLSIVAMGYLARKAHERQISDIKFCPNVIGSMCDPHKKKDPILRRQCLLGENTSRNFSLILLYRDVNLSSSTIEMGAVESYFDRAGLPFN